jgi:hypothetical protein
MPRYVILEHDHPELHWDLMLETGDVLRTWRLLELPAPGKAVAAEALSAHRKAYLDYEGPVSGNRGTVTRWDHGLYTGDSGAEEVISLTLTGDRLQGQARLRRVRDDRWEFVFTSPE